MQNPSRASLNSLEQTESCLAYLELTPCIKVASDGAVPHSQLLKPAGDLTETSDAYRRSDALKLAEQQDQHCTPVCRATSAQQKIVASLWCRVQCSQAGTTTCRWANRPDLLLTESAVASVSAAALLARSRISNRVLF